MKHSVLLSGTADPSRRPAIVALLLLALVACDGDERDRAPQSASTPAAAASPEAPRPQELEHAARAVIAFLQGDPPSNRFRLADNVTLYLAPEGGGARAAVTRESLANRANWKVASHRQGTEYSFVPPGGLTKLTTRVGRHLNCLDYPLSSRFEQLALLPHVGTKLEPESASSCLQSWNLTLVFDPELRPLTIVAAVYDQWEW